MKPRQILSQCVRVVLRGIPIKVVERLSNYLPPKQRERLLRLAVQNRNVAIAHGINAGLQFNAGKYHYTTALGTYEIPVQEKIAESLVEGGVFYDIGANAGFFSLLAAKRAGARGKVFAFEPEPRNADLLRRNAQMNGFTQIKVIEKAVSDQSGSGTLFVADNSGMHSLAASGRPGDVVNQMKIEKVQVDQLVESGQLPPPNVVKIDVEGLEYSVMRGMARTIEQHRPRIIYETDARRESGALKQEKDIERFLHNQHYEIFRLEDSYDYTSHYVAHFLAEPLDPAFPEQNWAQAQVQQQSWHLVGNHQSDQWAGVATAIVQPRRGALVRARRRMRDFPIVAAIRRVQHRWFLHWSGVIPIGLPPLG